MAHKVFVLSNKNSADYFKLLIKKASDVLIDSDKRKKKIDEPVIFSEYESFANANFKELIKVKDTHKAADIIHLFVTPELFWKSEYIDEGYEYALEVINSKLGKHTVQLKFLSVAPFELILEKGRAIHRRIIEAFPFYNLIDDHSEIIDSLFNEYTKTHFNLIKKLSISSEGYISFLQHEVKSLINEVTPNEEKDMYLLNSLSNLQHLTEENLSDLKIRYNSSNRQNILNECNKILSNIQQSIFTSVKLNNHEKVLIVEDDPKYRLVLKDYLKEKFETVDVIDPEHEADFLSEVKKILPVNANDYDIIFLDLLYKKINNNWYNENGIDLLKKIKNKNPFCVIPIITGLPRGIVSSLAKEIANIEIPSDLLFTKTMNQESLKHDIDDRLPAILKSCAENKKIKNSVSMHMSMPNRGLFSDSIKLQLYNRIWVNSMESNINYKELFDEKVKKAFELYKKFKDGIKLLDVEEWDGILFHTTSITSNKITIDDVWEKLVTIFTYRLIIIDKAVNSKNNMLSIDDEFLLNCSKNRRKKDQGTLSKGFLGTKLGFNISTVKEVASAGNMKDAPIIGYNITFNNFFEHELDFYIKNISETQSEYLKNSLNEDEKQWVKTFLEFQQIQDNIISISSEYSYMIVDDSFVNQLDYNWLFNFLNNIKSNYNESIAQVIAEKYDPYKESNIENKFPDPIKAQLKRIAQMYFNG